MTALADQINMVYDSTHEMDHITTKTKIISENGILLIDELNEKSKETTEITQKVICKVEQFKIQSEYIHKFVNNIDEIASQTNLLSLNASIEAAKVGQAGSGFAVIAKEIRSLADNTLHAADQIQKIVKELQLQTDDTIDTVKEAGSIVDSQSEALNKTNQVFYNIDEHISFIVTNLVNISEGMKEIESVKSDTLMAIESISSISQQTANSTEEVNATALVQTNSTKHLKQSVSDLGSDALKLMEAIKIFEIS